MARMRVALVNRLAGIHLGGGEIYDLSLAQALRRAGTEVHLITGRAWMGQALSAPAGLPVRHVRTPYLRGLAHRLGRAGWRLFDQDLRLFERAALRELGGMTPRPDLVQVTGLPDLAVRIEEELGLPVLLLFPGPPSERHREAIRRARHVAGVGAVTPYLREQFPREIHDMTAGVDAALFRPGAPSLRGRLGIPEEARVILFAGRLVPLKNLPLLIDVYEEVRREIPESRLLVAGDGPLRSDLLRAAARARIPVGRSGRGKAGLIHAGEIPHDEMPGCYASSDLLVLTSRNESFSLVALEAMACGVAVVVPAVGYLPRLVQEGESGLLYPAGNRDACVDAVLRLLRDPGERRRLGGGGREAALKRHSWDAVAEAFLALYRKMLAS